MGRSIVPCGIMRVGVEVMLDAVRAGFAADRPIRITDRLRDFAARLSQRFIWMVDIVSRGRWR